MSFRQNTPGLGITEMCKNLIIINVVVFLLVSSGIISETFSNKLSLHLWGASDFMPFQLITSMFMHGSLTHLALNMLSLWMFGSILEHFWGAKRFLTYYFVTGIGGGLLFMLTSFAEIYPFNSKLDSFIENPNKQALTEIINHKRFENFVPFSCYFGPDNSICRQYEKFESNVNTVLQGGENEKAAANETAMYLSEAKPYWLNIIRAVGASGAIFGLLLAFGMMFPNEKVYMYMFVPIKAKYFVVVYGLVELYMGMVNHISDNVAHFAHLGGMLFGWILIKRWQSKGKLWW